MSTIKQPGVRAPGIGTNIDQQTVLAASQGSSMTPGRVGWEGWFGPGQPQPSSAPPEVKGRQWELPVGVNMLQTRKQDGVSHAQLRVFADACDIVRLLIETRKDQVCGRAWNFKVIEPTGPAKPKRGQALDVSKAPDERLALLTNTFKRPDRSHSWSEWLRMLLEDLFVLDAPCLYIHRTIGGELYALRPVDGATIKRIVDVRGWVPEVPDPAYQQILQGVVASSFTTDELIYKPRNVRTHKIYGYSHVEQVIITAKQWLSRQASNLEYYESGNLPEGFLQGAEGWSPEQLSAYQTHLNQMLSGSYAERHKVRVVPHDAEYQAAKEPALKSEFDEWLARIACFCFGYPPTPFIKQMNRSTSDNDAEAGDEEGEAPICAWIKELMDQIVQNVIGHADIEFVWEDKEAVDPKEKADIDKLYIDARVIDPNEVRAEMGLEPLPPPMPTVVDQDGNPVPPKPGAFGGGGIGGPGPGPGPGKTPPKPGEKPDDKAKKLAKAATQGQPVDLDTPEAIQARDELAKELAAIFGITADEAAEQIAKFLEVGERNAAIISSQVSLAKFADIEKVLSDALAQVAKDAGAGALADADVSISIDLVNERAVDWAAQRAAELIKTDASGGELIESTRMMLRATIEQAVEEGWSNEQLAKGLREMYGFSKTRAMTIARTEIAMASVNGSMLKWIASGFVTKKLWLLSNSEGVCTICQGNTGEAVPLLGKFPSGDMSPPAHPNCRCSVAPIVEDK